MKKIILSILQSIIMLYMPSRADEISPVTKIELNSDWKFRQSGSENWYPAAVPGCVHTDLLKNNLIQDPFYRTNEKQLQWIDKNDWEYESTFNLNENFLLNNQKIEIEFHGLDTYADVSLNGSRILSADNMFRVWRIDCKDFLKPGINRLNIIFHSPVKTDIPKLQALGYQLPATNDQSENGGLDDQKISVFARKAPYHYGWDWGPRFVTSGIWKSVNLIAWNRAKIDNVQFVVSSLTSDLAAVNARLEINSSVEATVNLRLVSRNTNEELLNKPVRLKPGLNLISAFFEIKKPKLWWPNGLGEHYLYSIESSINDANDLLDLYTGKLGLRTVDLVREKDDSGTGFYFKVNGKPVFMKGANYIPSDIFLDRVTAEDYEKLIRSAYESNMNMLRVWGGGIYEKDIFYDLCDQYGILVWQDFMFACSMYPGDEQFLENIRQEAVDNVKRLRNHPSIALWCGNNEIEDAWANWGWKHNFSFSQQKTIYDTYKEIFLNILPEVCREFDGTRAYWPSSPSSDFGRPSGSNSGDMHYWGVWHAKEPFENFDKKVGRFVSEYGFQSFPEFKTVKSYTLPEDWDIESEVMAAHQRSGIGNLRIRDYLKMYYKTPKDFQSFLYAGQVLQAYGIKQAIEAHRRNMPYCMGTLYWQLDDCWPVASWSSIDYFKRWKAQQYIAKKAFQNVLISPVEKDGLLRFYVISDLLDDFTGEITIKTIDFSGKELYKKTLPVLVKAASGRSYLSLSLNELLAGGNKDNSAVLAQISSDGEVLSENLFYFKKPKDLELEDPGIKFRVSRSKEGYIIDVSSVKLAKDVFLSLEDNSRTETKSGFLAESLKIEGFYKDEGFFTDNYFDLVPGSTKKVILRTSADIPEIEKRLKVISLVDSY